MSVEKVSPANRIAERSADRKRVPMSTSKQRLAVPEIPGYFMYWMRGEVGRLEQALAAGYEFVNQDEVSMNNRLIGGDAKQSGNTDMGTRVSCLASPTGGEVDDQGQPLRLYLMKLKEEWHQEDLKNQEDSSKRLVEGLRNGNAMNNGNAPYNTTADAQARYVKTSKLF